MPTTLMTRLRSRFLPVWMVLCLAAVVCLAAGMLHHRRSARADSLLASDQVVKRALTLSVNAWGPTELSGPPLLHRYLRSHVGSAWKPKRYWAVPCRTDTMRMNLLIDAATGQLDIVIGRPRDRDRRGAPLLATARQAVVKSAYTLQSLQMVEKDAELILKGTPVATQGGSAWDVSWRVRAADGSQRYVLRTILDRKTGVPTWIARMVSGKSLA